MTSPLPSTEARAVKASAARPALRRARALLGTYVDISVHSGAPLERQHEAIDAAFATIARIGQLMSCHDPHSELSQLNRTAHRQALPVDAHTFAVLMRALQIAQQSQGAFDPCIGGSLERSGRLPPVPEPTPSGGCWRDVRLLEGSRVRYERPLRVDLGGIAKGYAVDLAVECLRRHGMEGIVVNAGGDLRVAGPRAFSVGLRDPRSPGRIAHVFKLRQCALATSATDGCAPAALLDPRNEDYASPGRSISVQAARCMDADALTKVVMFAPPRLAESMLAQFDAKAFAMSADAALPGPDAEPYDRARSGAGAAGSLPVACPG